MDDLKFRELVGRMLDAQQTYFKKGRQPSDLRKSIELEQQVRQELAAGPDAKTLIDGPEPGEQYHLFE